MAQGQVLKEEIEHNTPTNLQMFVFNLRKSKFADGVQLNHFPDEAKSRSNYLPLLELSVKESQDNDRNMHYLGREYMFHRDYDKAITTLTKRLAMLSAS